ncbi:hypothetical protein HDU93_003806, partial [Gonapodya sp. JEL0774]
RDDVCRSSDIGNFIVRSNSSIFAPIRTVNYKFRSDPSVILPKTVTYAVNVTGYYCVAAISTTDDFDETGEEFLALAWFKNPYGELPGAEYHKLPFYGIMSILYLGVGMIWMILCFVHWREILPIQSYLSVVIFFIMLENAFTYGHYDYFNTHGAPSNFLLVLVVVLSAGRNTASLFILLIVSLGFGVVKPTLGSTMQRCIGLAWIHFVFGNLYIAGQMVSAEFTLFNVMLFVLPVALAMTVFYIWTISALTQTIKILELRRQVYKLQMYQSLYRLLIAAMAGLAVYLAGMTIFFRNHRDEAWLPRNWKLRWSAFSAFWTEGYMNIEYAIAFWTVLFLWRPTANNSRYGLLLPMSDEEALDDDDYEAGDVGLGVTNAQKRDLAGKGNGYSEEDAEEEILQWAEKNLGQDANGVEHRDGGVGDSGEDVDEQVEDDDEAKLIRDEQNPFYFLNGNGVAQTTGNPALTHARGSSLGRSPGYETPTGAPPSLPSRAALVGLPHGKDALQTEDLILKQRIQDLD